MKKYLLVIAAYKGDKQIFFESYISPRNKEYCEIHGYEYIEITQNVQSVRGKFGWVKPFKIKELMDSILNDGDIITCLDADIIIAKPQFEFIPKNGKSFAYAIDSGNTHCMGAYSIMVNDWSRKMIDIMIDDERYNRLGSEFTQHERLGYFINFWDLFYDQASWYSMAGIKNHSDQSFWELPNNGWHSNKNSDTIYSINELEQHVDIFPTEWNVTEMPGESPCMFNINKCKPEDVIIRHFAGGQPWREHWLKKAI